jgi:hypothetical protein
VDKNPPVSWILTHIFNSLKFDPFDLMFWSRCSPWSDLLDRVSNILSIVQLMSDLQF